MEAEVTDPGSDPVAQEMARLVNDRLGQVVKTLDAVVATQRLHGEALGTILTRLDGHDARFDTLTEQLQTNHEGVMAVLAELVGKKTT